MESTTNILIIDDEVGIREGCRKALEPQGFSIGVADTLMEGKRKILEAKYDLILLDVMLPDGRGVDLLEVIHNKDPDTTAVIITGFATVELAIEAIKRGAYDFISKPFDSDLLLMTVNQGLEKRRLSLEAKRLKAIEKEAVELLREKEEIERLGKFKSNFLMVVVHELRSPIGGAQSLLRTLLRGLAGDLNQQQLEILSRIEARLNFFSVLINDLITLAISKELFSATPLQKIEIQSVLQTVAGRFHDEAKSKQIAFTIQSPKKPIAILAFEDGLDKILSNLISNAIKYTPEKGKVIVTLSRFKDKATIRVSDTGIGIPGDAIPKIWEEFFRAPNAKSEEIAGTGLGLSIVKQYVDLFDGKVNVQSSKGKGSTFEVVFDLKK